MSAITSNKRAKVEHSSDPMLSGLLNDCFVIDKRAVVKVVQKNPSSVKAKYTYHDNYTYRDLEYDGIPLYPLQIAILKHPSLELIKFLYEAHPEAIKDKDYCGRTAMHMACEKGASLEVLSLLYEVWPESLQEKDVDYKLPLHYSLIDGVLENVLFLLEKYTPALKAKDRQERLPLHYFLDIQHKNEEFEVFSLLLDRFPAAVAEKDHNGQLPLHIACQWSSLEVVTYILDRYPAAVEVQDNFGQTPLHVACMYKAPTDLTALLLEKYAEATTKADSNGMLPIHYAMSSSKESLSLLLEKYPESIEATDNHGKVPLHWACAINATFEIISFLLEKYPIAANIMDIASQKPHHCLRGTASELRRKKIILIGVSQLVSENNNVNDMIVKRILNDFIRIRWWSGVVLVLDLFPSIIHSWEEIGINAIPSLISMMGRRCKLLTVWNMVRNRQDVLQTNN